MSDTPNLSNQQGPENQTASYRAAKLAVIILSSLIILALIALVVGFVSKMRGKSGTTSTSSSAFQLPPGGEIVEMQTQSGRLILRVRSSAGEEIDIIDTQDGRLVSQIKERVDVPR